ncbi:hypothetical protein B0I33_104296 [Prauserella shujinwangii]|uniref:Uncharacterized protein n=1 Tax=Prauserella shujinwangii TaxID=1453103 RepID=A0A2T0LWY7_9PSEU|nr:hypothetical protein B0I33_104296 [Prauserella shujinwangii]
MRAEGRRARGGVPRSAPICGGHDRAVAVPHAHGSTRARGRLLLVAGRPLTAHRAAGLVGWWAPDDDLAEVVLRGPLGEVPPALR